VIIPVQSPTKIIFVAEINGFFLVYMESLCTYTTIFEQQRYWKYFRI